MSQKPVPLVKPWRGPVVFTLAALFLFYEMALQVSPSVMTHQIMRDFSTNAEGVGFISGLFFYSYTAMQIPAGLLIDRYNFRRIATIVIAFCAVGALSFGIARGIHLAAFSRFFMGIGGAFAFTAVLVIAARWFAPQWFALLVGIAQFMGAFGAFGGQIFLATLMRHFHWRTTMWLMFWMGVVLMVATWLLVRAHPRSQGAKHNHTKKVGVMQSLSVVLKHGQTWWVACYSFLGWGPVMVFAALWGVPFLKTAYDISNTTAATMVSLVWIGQAVASPFVGWLSDYWRHRCILMTLLALLGLVTSIVIIYSHPPLLLVYPLTLILGVATAGQVLTFAVVKDNNSFKMTGTAVAFNNTAQAIAGAVLQPLVGFMLNSAWHGGLADGTPIYTLFDYRSALIVVPLCFLLAVLVSQFLIRETHAKAKFPHPYELDRS